MPSYQVFLTKQAEKAIALLSKSQPKMAKRIADSIDRLSADADMGIPLRGELKGFYKYRVGPYRIIYEIRRKRLIIVIIDIGHRRDIYR